MESTPPLLEIVDAIVTLSFRLAEKTSLLHSDSALVALIGSHDGDALWPSVHADDADVVERLLRREQAEGFVNLRLRHCNGRVRCVRCDYTCAATSENDGFLLTLKLRDARAIAREQAQADVSPHFLAVMENSDDYIFFKDRHHVMTWASQSLSTLCPPATHWRDLIGKTDYDIFPEAYADAYYRLEKQVFTRGQIVHEAQEYISPSGMQGWVDNRKYPIHSADGELVGLYGIARDITEQRQAETALRKSEQELHALYAAMTEGVALYELVLDPVSGEPVDYRLLEVNPAFEAMLGIRRELALGRLASEIFGQVPFLDTYARVAMSGLPTHFESWFEPLGMAFSVSVFSPARRHFATLMNDVSERKRAEESLRASEERLRLVMAAANQGWFDLDPDSGQLTQPVEYAALFGYPADNFPNTLPSWLESVHPQDRQSVSQELLATLSDREAHVATYRQQTASGEWKWIESIGKAVPREQGQRIIGIHIDVSIRQRWEQEQLRLNRALRLLSECNLLLSRASSEGQLLADVCRLIVNTGGYRMAWVGVPDEGPDKPIRPLAHSGQMDEYLLNLNVSWDPEREDGRGPAGAALRRGLTQVIQNVLIDTRMLPWRERALLYGYRSLIALPLKTEGRTFAVLMVYAGDASAFGSDEIRLLEELAGNLSFGILALRTRERRDSAEAASRAKSSFIANISHEIRTPLNAINGMVHMIRRAGISIEQLERLDKIDNASQHLLEIINAVLDLSKVEAGKFELATEEFRLDELLQSAAAMIQERARAKQLRLEVDPSPGLRLVGDPTRLKQALLNYLSNAVKFTTNGHITLRCRVLENSHQNTLLRFEVEDSGIGIAPEVLPRLFSAFEQGDNSITRRYGGTGLGLAITRKLVQLMDGEAGVASTLGEGSTFWFTARLSVAISKHLPAPPPIIEQAEQAVRQGHAGKRVLLAEDEPVNQEIAQMLLAEVGLKVEVASDGAEAVTAAGLGDYDLILMDMQMPHMDGLEATQRIRRLPAHSATPIVAMTANAFPEDRERCLMAGMNDFVAKPVDPEAFYATLLRALGPLRSTESAATSQSQPTANHPVSHPETE